MGMCNCTIPYSNPDACKTCPNNNDRLQYNQNGTVDHINTNFEIGLEKLNELRKQLDITQPPPNMESDELLNNMMEKDCTKNSQPKKYYNCHYCDDQDSFQSVCDNCGEVVICETCYNTVLQNTDDPFSEQYICDECYSKHFS